MTLQTQASLLNQRQAGVLLHISSLPSAFYTGDLGVESYRFIDFLHEIGAKVWQTLPINMPHADNSPYQCLSAHAGNPDFISLESLQAQGLLTKQDCAGLITSKLDLLNKAYLNFSQQSEIQAEYKKLRQAFNRFCKKQASWLDDFALFLALRQHFNQAGWDHWPEPYKNRDKKTIKQVQVQLAHEIAVVKFTQFVFFSQWLALKAYAAEKNIALFGDIPIFVAYDSADVWAHSDLFKLNSDKTMSVVAGVPPDYFSETGQRWGNPHYNWEAMQQDGFAWWISRMATQSELFDIVRIDHFRGLEAAWEIPAVEDTAINGEWVLAPGDALLGAIKQALPEINLVAEDLGIITIEVDALRKKYHLPGMKILQFAFSGASDNPYLPENIVENSVVYTGTHDNDTTLSWYSTLDDYQRGNVHSRLAALHGEGHTPNMPNDLIDMALETTALLAIVPMQDILQLNGHHRMNTPGTTSGNWHWRFSWQQLTAQQKNSIHGTIARTGR
ncbi:4-alpha-glucanotransferase [Methylotenera mobilis]|uniref:4-alpha-glucanotransferase n=1 Tax=Methylotenera mobilis (strain JLW8 / ATCC BAA-1282 / DSM 17540) TaxID=583345 RepID=C6WUZ2_METML|nr:4-alpha-glucanotransferase [Methylotenera mobilis]ACT47741.1 4-alpha-glucanotransferase [Methylotenera mobilis JLW8]